jgi:hypothetical protein
MPASMSSASSSPDALASSLVSRTEARLRIFAIASASASCGRYPIAHLVEADEAGAVLRPLLEADRAVGGEPAQRQDPARVPAQRGRVDGDLLAFDDRRAAGQGAPARMTPDGRGRKRNRVNRRVN